MHRQQLRNVAVYKAATTVQSLVNPGGGSSGGKNRRYSTEPNKMSNTLRGPLSQDGGGLGHQGSQLNLTANSASYANMVNQSQASLAAALGTTEDEKADDDGKKRTR